ncbi:MAG: bifunctional DNA-formamidopyrimidine glycosylase/DNA-(apurinic or apyrimidinic site) lyase [Pseudomonadota bacterium]
MPELPEVETVMRGLAPVMQDQRIEHAEVRRPDLRWPLPPDLAKRLTGARVEGLRRRSKYGLFDLSTGEIMLLHLGMSGRILITGDGFEVFHRAHAPLAQHDHIVLRMSNGANITLNDPRRFGFVDLFPRVEESTHRMLSHLGPEPLGNEFNSGTLRAAFLGRRAPVKAALLDQRIVSGLGNIYVCEALHRSGISPVRAAGRIGVGRLETLTAAIRDVLKDAIEAGGSSLRDHRQTNGELGYFQHTFRVYDREGFPCVKEGCAGVVRRVVQSGRSSFYCATCQR